MRMLWREGSSRRTTSEIRRASVAQLASVAPRHARRGGTRNERTSRWRLAKRAHPGAHAQGLCPWRGKARPLVLKHFLLSNYMGFKDAEFPQRCPDRAESISGVR